MTTLKAESDLPYILALDPGGTTGYCYADPSLCTTSASVVGHIGPHEHHADLYDGLHNAHKFAKQGEAELHIVCEQFEFRQTERHRDFINYIPREYIGVVKLYVQWHPEVHLFMQSAAQAKGFFDDDKVKKLGLWIPRRKHGMDAVRHYLYHRVFTLGDKSLLQQLR